MAGYQLQRQQILAEQLRGATRAVLMIDAVKAVAANSSRQPFVRAGIDERRFGEVAVEAGIEHRDLADVSQALSNDFYSFEFGAVMQGRKCGHLGDRSFYIWSNYCRLPEILSAVDHAMADHIDFRGR